MLAHRRSIVVTVATMINTAKAIVQHSRSQHGLRYDGRTDAANAHFDSCSRATLSILELVQRDLRIWTKIGTTLARDLDYLMAEQRRLGDDGYILTLVCATRLRTTLGSLRPRLLGCFYTALHLIANAGVTSSVPGAYSNPLLLSVRTKIQKVRLAIMLSVSQRLTFRCSARISGS